VHASAAAPVERISVPGLKQPVEILRGKWVVSHIYAGNEHDLFFAQGYNVARDRLFQLELWRRQATGTMAEIAGLKELKRDIGNRLFLYRGDLTQELNWYHPRGVSIVEALVAAINAFIAETHRNPSLLTPEFGLLGLKPGDWTPAVVISRFNGVAPQYQSRARNRSCRSDYRSRQGEGSGVFSTLRSGPYN
jgi:penicillin amidase